MIKSCWDGDPQNRPRFADLVQQFSDLLEQEAGYLDLCRSLSWRKHGKFLKEDSKMSTPILKSDEKVSEKYGEDVELKEAEKVVTESTDEMILMGEDEVLETQHL